ncbi:formyltransferase family protein [Thermomonas sp.]|uniref:formyltransferase family protein n=1 Tax=Thermomonas sp. TaxID=1971895 RepID=UPI00262482CF|nr:formyltransferase family protein [Thermomonas sp.]
MRVMLVGQKWIGVEALALLLTKGHDVASVAAPAGDRLHAAASAAGVPVGDPGRILSASWVPPGVELLVAAHAHCFINRGARQRTRFGAIGYHPSLLPLHRGRDAVRWTIHMRDQVAGGTVYWMTDRADGGPIAAQAWCLVRPDDTPETLWRRELGPMGLRLLERVLGDVGAGRIVKRPQDESLASWEPAFDRPALSKSRPDRAVDTRGF